MYAYFPIADKYNRIISVKKSKNYLSTKSGEETVIYHGNIKKGYFLLLKFKSLIKGRSGREKYYFAKVDNLKYYSRQHWWRLHNYLQKIH